MPNEPEIDDKIDDKMISIIRHYINNGSINFLVGSGLSTPFISLLPVNFEKDLQQAEEEKNQEKEKQLKITLFQNILLPNLLLLEQEPSSKQILTKYQEFVITLNSIISQRKHNLIHRQINIFTTNYDLLFESALESCKIDYNDGFSGRFCPIYNPDNFKKTFFKRGMFLDSSSEISCFNILKLHGSVSWTNKNTQEVILKYPQEIISHFKSIDPKNANFLLEYNKLSIVNPSNKKFLDTVLLDIYSDLLRIFSSELEKQNSILFVCGFSFNDDHIYRLTLRAANVNPTLQIFIFIYENNEKFQTLEKNAINNNIKIIGKKFDLDAIIDFFHKIENRDVQFNR